jgi:hypothetical protein
MAMNGWDKAMDAAVRLAIGVRGVEPEHVVLSMVRRIARADDMDANEKLDQILRVLAALERVYAETNG